jgi:hypothetical protein
VRSPGTPLVVLTVGFSFSLAANLLWTWPGGPVRILGGALASIALPAAIHMWPQVQVHGRVTRTVRNAAMTGIAGLAALTTFVHAASLLMQHGEIRWLAYAYPVVTELLVVLAVLTLSPKVKAAPKQRVATRATPPGPESPPVSSPPTSLAQRGVQRAEIIAWVAAQKTMPTPKAVQARFRHCSRSTVTRALRDARSA